MEKFSLIIPSSRPEFAKKTELGISSLKPIIFDGTGYPSFSKLINDCIISAEEEIVIIVADKARPSTDSAIRMVDMIESGIALVALYRFAFFGFKKDLIRKIGWFDERFYGGGYEDADMIRRLKLNNLSYHEEESIEYEKKVKTAWAPGNSKFFNNKWNESPSSIVKLIKEDKYNYDIGGYKGSIFKTWDEHHKMIGRSKYFSDIKIIDESFDG